MLVLTEHQLLSFTVSELLVGKSSSIIHEFVYIACMRNQLTV